MDFKEPRLFIKSGIDIIRQNVEKSLRISENCLSFIRHYGIYYFLRFEPTRISDEQCRLVFVHCNLVNRLQSFIL